MASDGGRAKKSDKKQRKRGATDESSEDFIDPDTPAGQKKSAGFSDGETI